MTKRIDKEAKAEAPVPSEPEHASSEGNSEDAPKPPHPIAAAIDKLVLRVSDVRQSLRQFIPQAAKWHLKEVKRWEKEMETYMKRLDLNDAGEPQDSPELAVTIKGLFDASAKLERLEKSEMLEILATGHFLAMFTAFDAFTGDLLTALYQKKPEMFRHLQRSMTISEMLQHEHIDDIKTIILQSEIEAFRRNSYVEQFQLLETRFGIPLKKFSTWPLFVECAQRRNLFTHCDGLVSDQYLQICHQEGFEVPKDVKKGDKLKLSSKYLIEVCAHMIEVGLKLGQTLWRKVLEEELEKADEHLQVVQYDFLLMEEWQCAFMAGEFAVSLPRHSSDVLKTIMFVNYVISLKALGRSSAAETALSKRDWNALNYDFRLAERVLREDYEAAADIMIKIGKNGDFVTEQGYHTWPLFKEFRQSPEFLKAYKSVYGYEFTSKLKESAEESKKDALEEIVHEEVDLQSDPMAL